MRRLPTHGPRRRSTASDDLRPDLRDRSTARAPGSVSPGGHRSMSDGWRLNLWFDRQVTSWGSSAPGSGDLAMHARRHALLLVTLVACGPGAPGMDSLDTQGTLDGSESTMSPTSGFDPSVSSDPSVPTVPTSASTPTSAAEPTTMSDPTNTVDPTIPTAPSDPTVATVTTSPTLPTFPTSETDGS